MTDAYEPREDTFLIAEQLERFARGRVLDMGTGSGYLAAIAAKTAEDVVACDINPDAMEYAKGKYSDVENIAYVRSDLFSAVTGKFDLIVFNPPYLPDESRCRDVALDGGPEGWELIGRFLSKVSGFLNDGGRVLLLFSSLSKKEKVEELIGSAGFSFEETARKELFSETLYVYVLDIL